jgi:valyl-tRNA synthetase
MSLPKRYNPRTAEPALRDQWLAAGTYHFDPNSVDPLFSIDTPPPTVSGHLHMGHVYSYSHTDFIARFQRMNGRNVFYPMGYDDNGLPTERLVEQREGETAVTIGRELFIEKCLAISADAEQAYKSFWQRLGLSIDWRYSYRTIDDSAQRISQTSFIDLLHKGYAYRKRAPTIWCPECHTAIAQADLDDFQRESVFYTLDFRLANGRSLPIATTRPELLPACVAVFVHPEDGRFAQLIGQSITVPYFAQSVPLLADPAADPQKGTGAVMCCTFGDTADVAWWHTHKLPLIEAIGRDGHMTAAAGEFTGLDTTTARAAIIASLRENGLLLDKQPISQAVRVHERCDTAVEYIVTQQWFIRLLDIKDELIAAGSQIKWVPAHMENRYRQWIENLSWDWCISRQRTFGVPIPIWYCDNCGEVIVAELSSLPVDPQTTQPEDVCTKCNGRSFSPETDLMDTWATSSMSPQIVAQQHRNDSLYESTFPFTLRPQAHEIIRTWAVYTIAKSWLNFRIVPFKTIAISGWGLAPEGSQKISKSRGGGPMEPVALIEQYSADAVRYWAASTGPGKDAIISEEKVQAGARLMNKLWNAARFSAPFLMQNHWKTAVAPNHLTLADRWLLARLQLLIKRVTYALEEYDYATAKSETEHYFWKVLADNYLEMAKLRLYGEGNGRSAAQFALSITLETVLKLFAPFFPFITERIYNALFASLSGQMSIHRTRWPQIDAQWLDETAVTAGDMLVDIATAVRRYKSEHSLALGTDLTQLQLHTSDAATAALLTGGILDLRSITRAQTIAIMPSMDSTNDSMPISPFLALVIEA